MGNNVEKRTLDFIVEQGTSGIWTYRKWNSGIAECWGTDNVTISTTLNAWGNVYSYALKGYNYPFTFASIPTQVREYESTSGSFWSVAYSNTTSNTGKTEVVRPSSTNHSIYGKLSFYVIGKWK